MIKYILSFLLFTSTLFAISPFSLEGFTKANVKVLYKGKVLSKEYKKQLQEKVEKELTKLGIATSSKSFTNLLVKIQILKFKTDYAVNITLFISEDAKLLNRSEPHEAIAITYRKNDLFDTDKNDLLLDIEESVIKYLLVDFAEQYKAEN